MGHLSPEQTRRAEDLWWGPRCGLDGVADAAAWAVGLIDDPAVPDHETLYAVSTGGGLPPTEMLSLLGALRDPDGEMAAIRRLFGRMREALERDPLDVERIAYFIARQWEVDVPADEVEARMAELPPALAPVCRAARAYLDSVDLDVFFLDAEARRAALAPEAEKMIAALRGAEAR